MSKGGEARSKVQVVRSQPPVVSSWIRLARHKGRSGGLFLGTHGETPKRSSDSSGPSFHCRTRPMWNESTNLGDESLPGRQDSGEPTLASMGGTSPGNLVHSILRLN